jgi:glycosyltransferase involved in cell wall biosynthesis
MLLNLKKMREGGYAEKLLEAKRRSTDMSLMDQDVFNRVFDGQVLPLPVRYNCLFVNLVRAYCSGSFRFGMFNKMFSTDYAGFRDLLEDAAVVHYSSKYKPWKVGNTPLAGEWHEMHALSPCGSVPLARTDSTDMFCSFDYMGPAGTDRPVIVSLTSFPKRIKTVHVALESLLAQTMKPDRIVLWLAREEFPGGLESLPQSVLDLIPKGIEIGWADKNLRAYKKFYYALRDNPEALVITVDDDLASPSNLVKNLYCSYLRHPDCISALRTHKMLFSEDGRLLPYRKWQMTCVDYVNRPNLALFATTGAGVLYPPHVVPAAALDADAFMSLCPNADDVWMKLVTAAAGIKVVNPCHTRCVLDVVDGSQDDALWEENVLADGNDTQIEAASKWCSAGLLHGQSVLDAIRSGGLSAEIQDADIQPPVPVRSTVHPKVSVIVPICNSALYLRKCLASLEQQTLHDIEIICVDDGSTDDPFLILEKHLAKDDRIGLIRQVRKGLSGACARGLSAARGDYVAFLPADGFCDRNFLSRLCEFACGNGCDVSVSGWFVCNNDAVRVEERRCFAKDIVGLSPGFPPASIMERSLEEFWEMPWNKLFRREFLLRRNVSFPEGEAASDGVVSFSAMALLAASRIGVVNKALVYQRARRSRESLAHLDGKPCSIVAALSNLKEKLEACGLYGQFGQLYKRFAISSCARRLMDFTTGRGFRELYACLRNGGFGRLGLDGISFRDVGWPLYRLYAAISENEDVLPFLLEAELQAKGRAACLKRAVYEGKMQRGKAIAEIKSLKLSESYRLGLFLTWPARKIWSVIKRLRKNGFAHTAKHAAGKG